MKADRPGERQRIAIVGAGAAGLAAAWLLHERHDVVLFEAADRAGGHIHTVQADVGDRTIPVELGAEFFFEEGYGGLVGLIDRFGLTRRTRKMTVTLLADDGRSVFAVPPRTLAGLWSCLSPRTIRRLNWMRLLARGAEGVAEAGDRDCTVRGLTEAIGMPRDVADGVVIPLIAASWGADPALAEGFSAYSVVRVMGLRAKHTPHSIFVEGGLVAYVDALVGDMPAVDLRLGAPVDDLRLEDGGLVLAAGGSAERFDQVVLACDWHNSAALCAADSRLEPWQRVFAACDDYRVRVALHRDPRFMPPRRSLWTNSTFELGPSAPPRTTVWSGAGFGAEVFRTWLRDGEEPPASTSHMAEYRHIAITPAHAARQARIAALQGIGGLWAAGMYTTGVDNHESALRSGLRVAERLAPDAERVRWLAERISA